MKLLSIYLPILTLGLLSPVLAEGDAGWLYTLAVHDESEHVSFSLMKEGWLAFDSWGDTTELQEKRYDLSPEHFLLLKKKFDRLFEKIQTTQNQRAAQKPFITFEKVGETITTLELSGDHPSVVDFIEWLWLLSAEPLPFSLPSTSSADSTDYFSILVTDKGIEAEGKMLSLQELETGLREVSADQKILIQADPSVALKEVNPIFQLCSELGLNRVSIASSKIDEDPSDPN